MSIELYTSTLKKLNSKIIPFVIICYFVANLDKTNISIAALQMNADLGLTASMYGLGVGMFYISYIIFEIPSNVIMTRIGARIWIARIMITWGIVSAGMSLVHTPTQLYVMRFLLGMAEAGFTPGIFPAGSLKVIELALCHSFIWGRFWHQLLVYQYPGLF